jgi:peptide deformylase
MTAAIFMERNYEDITMAVRPIIVVPHQCLAEESREIRNIDDRILLLAKDMADTMYRAPGLGLAANQVGLALRMIVFDVVYAYAEPKDKKKNPCVLINPVITLREGEECAEEGCLSVPDLSVEISRAACVQVCGVDIKGNPMTLDAEGLIARVLQHEIDHLTGTTILDHATPLKRGLYRRKLSKAARRDR